MIYYNGATHGAWCNTKTRRLHCKYCGSRVYYFTYDCGCKVFFEDLGHPWNEHQCQERQNVLDVEIRNAIRKLVPKVGIERTAILLEIEESEVKDAFKKKS